MKLSRVGFVIIIQSMLLMGELIMPYDNLQRRLALMLTNIMAVVGLAIYARILERRGKNIPISSLLAICLAVWLDAIGNFFGWYGRYEWWDHATHAIGTSAITMVACDGWAFRFDPQRSSGLIVWLALATSQTIAAWYEISEYVGDLWFATERVGARFDTPRDLLFNLLGALIGVGWWWAHQRLALGARKVV